MVSFWYACVSPFVFCNKKSRLNYYFSRLNGEKYLVVQGRAVFSQKKAYPQSDSGWNPLNGEINLWTSLKKRFLKKREKRRKTKKTSENRWFSGSNLFRPLSRWLGNGLDFISHLKTRFCLEISVSLPFLRVLARLIKSIWFHLDFSQTRHFRLPKGLNRFII